MNTRTKIVLIVTTGGVLAIGLYIYKHLVNKKSNENETDSKEKTMSTRGDNSLTQLNKSAKKNFEVSKCVSIEVGKGLDFCITKAVDLVLNQRVTDHEQSNTMKDLIEVNHKTVPKKDNQYEEDEVYSNLRSKVQPGTMKSRKRKSSNVSNDISCTNNNTILNFFNDLKNFADKEGPSFILNQPQTSIYLPSTVNLIKDELELGFDDAGYDSSAEDDLQLPEFMNVRSGGDNQTGRYGSVDSFSNKIVIITSEDELDKILHKYDPNMKYQIQFETRMIQSENIECDIIPETLLLLILKFLYEELNTGLIELSDNFTEERRRYFKVDMQVYISIIDLFLRKKEEYFLAVLSALMHRLGISQVNLDNTLVFYMNHADQNEEKVIQIKKAYDKVYQAGIKETIAPKAITKGKIREILMFQCEQYNNIKEQFPDIQMDVAEIMVIDYTYEEFGYDKEAIKAAFKKHNIENDEAFSPLINRLNEYQRNSFLNI